MLHANYKHKKDLKASVGKRLRFTETSIFGAEYRSTGRLTVANPAHTWFAKVDMKDDVIVKVL